MDGQSFDKGMAVIRGACMTALLRSAERFSVQKRRSGQGFAPLTEKHAAAFIDEMKPRYTVTCQEEGEMLHFTVAGTPMVLG